jgi:hypothetical protein
LTDVSFDATVGPPGFSSKAAGFGPRLASLSFEGSLRAAWTDTRRGTHEDGHQDIYWDEQPV